MMSESKVLVGAGLGTSVVADGVVTLIAWVDAGLVATSGEVEA